MKCLSLLIWLTQLGLSVAIPPVGFVLLALWLRSRFGLGSWVLVLGILLGIAGAISGLTDSLKALRRLTDSSEKAPPPTSFNDHD